MASDLAMSSFVSESPSLAHVQSTRSPLAVTGSPIPSPIARSALPTKSRGSTMSVFTKAARVVFPAVSARRKIDLMLGMPEGVYPSGGSLR